MLLLFLLFFAACSQQTPQNIHLETPSIADRINPQGSNIESRFPPPPGFFRNSRNSYSQFLRKIPLKPHGSTVHLYNGQEKRNLCYEAVLSYDTGHKDLQQCADAVMRIHAEYLFSQKRYNEISFDFTNGFKASFREWKSGKRISVKGGTCYWFQGAVADSSHTALREYLNFVYNYAGSLSLSKELLPVKNIQDIQAGDVWIIGGSPGHAVTVMDVVENSKGQKMFMLSQSYMPAQDIHILKNENHSEYSPWYGVDEIQEHLYTPEYTFYRDNLMRFGER